GGEVGGGGIGREVPGTPVVAGLAVVLVRVTGERPLDPGALRREKLACPIGLHTRSLRQEPSGVGQQRRGATRLTRARSVARTPRIARADAPGAAARAA